MFALRKYQKLPIIFMWYLYLTPMYRQYTRVVLHRRYQDTILVLIKY